LELTQANKGALPRYAEIEMVEQTHVTLGVTPHTGQELAVVLYKKTEAGATFTLVF
jgi:hypothetical protein